jgi:hypothetical protein
METFFINNLLRYKFELIWYHFVASACVAPPCCIRSHKSDINILVDNFSFIFFHQRLEFFMYLLRKKYFYVLIEIYIYIIHHHSWLTHWSITHTRRLSQRPSQDPPRPREPIASTCSEPIYPAQAKASPRAPTHASQPFSIFAQSFYYFVNHSATLISVILYNGQLF